MKHFDFDHKYSECSIQPIIVARVNSFLRPGLCSLYLTVVDKKKNIYKLHILID